MTFFANGTATKVTFANARHGTTQQDLSATISVEEFETLASAVSDADFIDLDNSYGSAGEDGTWVTMSVARGEAVKTVIDRNAAGPPNARRIEELIAALAGKVNWVSAHR